MENVSKALLIAAAVLVTILIISMAMQIVNMENSTEDASATMNSASVMAFNSKYEGLDGIRTGSTVKKILSYVINDNTALFGDSQKDASYIPYNLNVRSNDPDLLKHFSTNSSMISALNGSRYYGVRYPENIRQIQQAVKSNKKYKVWYSYNKNNGYIWEVHIDSSK